MKRYLLWIAAAVIAISCFSEKGTDVGKLVPVQLLQVYRENGMLVLETDTGDVGRGYTVEKALNDLKDKASGTIFLDTADYLLVTDETAIRINALASVMRPGTEVCMVKEPVDGEQAAKYLEAHTPEASILRIRTGGVKIPILRQEGEQFKLEK